MLFNSKRPKYDGSQDQEVVTQRWVAIPQSSNVSDKYYECMVKLWWNDVKPDIQCQIMQDDTKDVSFDDLPNIWPTANSTHKDTLVIANTAMLQCGHVFHPSAIALHFLTMHMKCPMCRKGSDHVLDVKSLPIETQKSLCEKTALMREVVEDETRMQRHQIEAILSDLELHIQIRVPVSGHVGLSKILSVLNTRILCTEDIIQQIESERRDSENGNNTPNLLKFMVHRSFQRVFRSVLQRYFDLHNNSTVLFVLLHPLVPVTICSKEVKISHVLENLFCKDEPQDSCLVDHDKKQIPLFCQSIAGNEAVAKLVCVEEREGDLTVLSMEINISMILNIASHVADIFGSIIGAQALAQQNIDEGPSMFISDLLDAQN